MPGYAVNSHMSEREIEEKKVKREGLGESEEKTEKSVRDEYGNESKVKTEKKVERD
jgi:hypothetical protein